MVHDLIVIGGGAAGVFGAIIAKSTHPKSSVVLLEKTAVLLAKVRISGGGRCNVTHACFDPIALSKNYPRGHKELIGPFHVFQPRDMIRWLESENVLLKTEKDGRIFPITDSSQTIIDALINKANNLHIPIHLKQKILEITKEDALFKISTDKEIFYTRRLLLATGNSSQGHLWAQHLGHQLKSPIPSLFTFNVPSSPLNTLSGISVEHVKISLDNTKLAQQGPLLITHFGFSGPAVIKLSAWAARYLFEQNYHCPLTIDWLPDLSHEETLGILTKLKNTAGAKKLSHDCPFPFPKNLWKYFVQELDKRYADLSNKELQTLSDTLHHSHYLIEGKTTHKEEFVTCGGIPLDEVNFKTMESKLCPGLFFAGEILDIDGVTGGFNFQNAWTTAFIAGTHDPSFERKSTT